MKQKRLQALLLDALRRHLAGAKPRVPEPGRLLWSWFCELSEGRSYGGNGPNPVSAADVLAWSQLKRWPVRDDHLAILRAMDRSWLDHVYSRKASATGGTPVIRSSDQPLTAAAFDAVFG